MTCFLCGAEYNPSERRPVASVHTESGETVQLQQINNQEGKTMSLCPRCTKAAIFGNTVNGSNLKWLGTIEYE